MSVMSCSWPTPPTTRTSACCRSPTDLEDWAIPDMHGVLGSAPPRRAPRRARRRPRPRPRTSSRSCPDHLVQREYRLLRGLAEDRLPTVDVVAAVTERTGGRDGLLITRHLDYSLPYRSLLSRARAAHPVPRRPAARRDGRAARAPAPRRVLLGRLLAVEHAVPPRRRRADRPTSSTPRRQSGYDSLTDGQRGVRPADRHRERRRWAARPPGRRRASCPTSTRGRSPPASRPLRGPVAGAHGEQEFQLDELWRDRATHRAPPRPRLRRRRDGPRRRRGGSSCAASRRGSSRAATTRSG